MKRNEKILVYAVTGFLAVVLVIAVVFGNEKLGTPPRTVDLAGMQKSTSDVLPEVPPEPASQGEPLNGGVIPKVSADTPVGPTVDEPKEAPITSVSLNMPTFKPVEERVLQLWGQSEKVGAYRRVTISTGDSLGGLALRWCGSASASAQSEVRLLNEGIDMNRLTVGERVLLPWVENEELLAAYDAARAQPSPVATPVAGGMAVMPEPTSSKSYTVAKGDSAWRIAARFVAANQVPAFIEDMKRLNPGVKSMDSLREGQKLLLPQ